MKNKIVILFLLFTLVFSLFAISSSALEVPIGDVDSTNIIESGFYWFDNSTPMDFSMFEADTGYIDYSFPMYFTFSYAGIAYSVGYSDILQIHTSTTPDGNELYVHTKFNTASSIQTPNALNVTLEDVNNYINQYFVGRTTNYYRTSQGFNTYIGYNTNYAAIFVPTRVMVDSTFYDFFTSNTITGFIPSFVVPTYYNFNLTELASGNYDNLSIKIPFTYNGNSYSSFTVYNDTDNHILYIYFDDYNAIAVSTEQNLSDVVINGAFNKPILISDFYTVTTDNIPIDFFTTTIYYNPYALQDYNYFNYGYVLGHKNGAEDGFDNGYDDGYNTGLEDNLTTNIFGNIVNTLDSLRLFDTISVLDIILTLIGLFVFVFVLKLIAGG